MARSYTGESERTGILSISRHVEIESKHGRPNRSFIWSNRVLRIGIVWIFLKKILKKLHLYTGRLSVFKSFKLSYLYKKKLYMQYYVII